MIKLFRKEECLWNKCVIDYNIRSRREEAAERIALEMNVPDMDRACVLLKIRNMKNSYFKELKKIKQAKQDGRMYKTRRFWFSEVDAFMKPYLKKTNSKTVTWYPVREIIPANCLFY